MVLGTIQCGASCDFSADIKKYVLSSVTGTFKGAPSSFQFGKSSLIARGSSTAPERICAPTSEPFSTTHTDKSGRLFSIAS